MKPAVTFVGVDTDLITQNAEGDQIIERNYKTLWKFQDQYFIASAAYFATDPEFGGISVNETFIYEANRNGDMLRGDPLAEHEYFSASHTQHRYWIEEAVMVTEIA
tara:strand:- start:385 stop:702 length:318 start_codon:yes stop_codon:yes gene_type:complete